MAKEFETYRMGLVYASVCTSLPLEVATERLNAEHPTGGQSAWEPSENESFATGQSNPCACNDHPETHRHYLFTC